MGSAVNDVKAFRNIIPGKFGKPCRLRAVFSPPHLEYVVLHSKDAIVGTIKLSIFFTMPFFGEPICSSFSGL